MKEFVEQFFSAFREMSTAKKVTLIGVVALVIAGFVFMFVWANKIDYQPLYTGISQEDAADIVTKLKERKVPFKLQGNGSTVLVPAEQVYELRLAMAGDGLPKGGGVGFEIFDHTDFSTTEFVQKLNYQRALQGELMRTIDQFAEVINSKVLIVCPRESVFVEDTKPPSASVLLNLRSSMSPDKVASIVHLVATAVEGLTPENITIVDTTGKTLFKGPRKGGDGFLVDTKFDYQQKLEKTIAERVQTMLERVVGSEKAIVRVSADIGFDKTEITEEIYDPDSAVVRSQQRQTESSEQSKDAPAAAEPLGGVTGPQAADKTKKDNAQEILNYEINRINRHTIKPVGTLERLSVAVVLDGTYRMTTGEDGVEASEYVPRTPEELNEIEKIVAKAIGYDPDRGDQITVSSFRFSTSGEMTDRIESLPVDWIGYVKQYARTAMNLLLVLIVFIFVVRPLIKSMKGIKVSEYRKPEKLPGPEQEGQEKAEDVKLIEITPEMKMKEEITKLTKNEPEKTQLVLKGWLNEAREQ